MYEKFIYLSVNEKTEDHMTLKFFAISEEDDPRGIVLKQYYYD
jgi:hypothetical protein